MKKYILIGVVVLLGIFGLTMFQKSSKTSPTTPSPTENQPLPTVSDQTQSTPSDSMKMFLT